jgi:hypothetical protein
MVKKVGAAILLAQSQWNPKTATEALERVMARAAIEAIDELLSEEDVGQPIETAPKDGTHVLLFVQYSDAPGEWVMGYWPYAGRPDMDELGSWKLVQAGTWAEDISVNGLPTHWRPPPPPPRGLLP